MEESNEISRGRGRPPKEVVAPKEERKTARLVEVPTQTTVAFELEDGQVVGQQELLLKIYEEVKEIKKAL